jgi:hypothetical protein
MLIQDNVTQYPISWNAYDSQAEACVSAGALFASVKGC